MNTNGEQIIQMYQSRLNLAIGSRFEIKPYQVVITDIDLGGFCGFKIADKIQMMFLDMIQKDMTNTESFECMPLIVIFSTNE